MPRAPRMRRWWAAAAAWSAAGEVVIPLPQGSSVALSTRGSTALMVRLHPEWHAEAFESPMVQPDVEDAKYVEVNATEGRGISSVMGSVLVTDRGTLLIKDPRGKTVTESAPLVADHPVIDLSTSPESRFYGRGAGPPDADQMTPGTEQVRALVYNRGVYAPYYYSTDGYALLAAANVTAGYKMPVVYHVNSSYAHWHAWVLKGAFQLYFMPAETLAKGTQSYYALTGAPPVPPRWAFGFMASRWGWEDREYVESTVAQFRRGGFPIDAIIMDFEWFVPETDYVYNSEGRDYYHDFGYNAKIWPSPKEQIPYFRDKLHVRFGGLRKPRLGSSILLEEAKKAGFLLPGPEYGGTYPPPANQGNYAWKRNLNFSNPAVRNWYGEKMRHYISDGVEFWWNDEGESDYFTFHWWNVAEEALLSKMNPNKRFYSLNRAWSPGMARTGATVWTGDILSTWKDLRETPGMMLNWVLAGAPYVAADIGGFQRCTSAQLLTRWMQVGVFLPTMRVHSVIHSKPHWPWLWGPQAANIMRAALEQRYRLLPYHYSLAHRMFRSLRDPREKPFFWMRPLAMDYPEDQTASALATTWMDGDILVAPILREDNQKEIYLPQGVWYQMGTPHISHGPLNIGGTATLWDIPMYCKAGTVLPIAPIVQFTDAFPGGPLEIQVYGGANGSFELVEDDGISKDYLHGDARSTWFWWNDAKEQLSWHVYGSPRAPGPQGFTHAYLTLFDKHGVRRTEKRALNKGGILEVGPQTNFV